MLTLDQKKAFETDGVVCLRGVLDSGEIDALRRAVDAQMAGLGTTRTGYDFEDIARQTWQPEKTVNTGPADRFDMQVMKEVVLSDEAARPLLEDDLSSDEGCFFYDVAAWKKQRGVRDVAFDSKLPAIVAELIDAKSLNFWEDTTFVKSPGTRQKTAFHQDLAYFQIMGDQCVIVWIALDPADLANGVTEYVRGSHMWGDVYAPNVFVSQTPLKSSPEQRCPDIEGHRGDYDIVSFDVQPGDVIVHHVLTVHGAGGNMSDRMRRAVSFRYCGDQVRYYDRPGAIPQVGVDHDLKDGDRLHSRDYPHVWPKPWPEMNLADAYDADFGRDEEAKKESSVMDKMTKRQLIATLGLTAKMLEELGGKMAQSPIGDQEFDDELNKSVMLAVANISRYRGELAGDLGIYETEAFEAFVRDEPEILDATG